MEPAPSDARKRQYGMPVTPARGGAAVLRPGTNFAKSSEYAPHFRKVRWVLLTHESGSSEIAHRRRRTDLPRLRPSQYHMESLRAHATSDNTTAGSTGIRP